jgi:hypothetical protein
MTQKLPFGYLAERSSAAKPAGLCGGQPRSHSVLYRSPFSEKIVCLSLRDRIGKCVPSDGKNWNFISSEPFLRSDDTTAKWKALRQDRRGTEWYEFTPASVSTSCCGSQKNAP